MFRFQSTEHLTFEYMLFPLLCSHVTPHTYAQFVENCLLFDFSPALTLRIITIVVEWKVINVATIQHVAHFIHIIQQ